MSEIIIKEAAIRNAAIECSMLSIEKDGTKTVTVKNSADLIKISELLHKPVLTRDYKTYSVVDGSVTYAYVSNKRR